MVGAKGGGERFDDRRRNRQPGYRLHCGVCRRSAIERRADRGECQALAALHFRRQRLFMRAAGNPVRREMRDCMRDPQLLGQQQKERERKVGKNPLGFHKKEFRILVENWICSQTRHHIAIVLHLQKKG